eukprot:CAMPEP_0115003600 /NCGR_PEP_ID=MMETSP0216-20121206/18710_1 /TAXON_ID=223996 /ORGANISM="Protocruzia adherens, Strain Boccale" /LENGTH=502 /DNA_ID=CAMNT_0002369441 /DNA_START=63 /DNA_END=1571 /DNA_ORIENTATION=-
MRTKDISPSKTPSSLQFYLIFSLFFLQTIADPTLSSSTIFHNSGLRVGIDRASLKALGVSAVNNLLQAHDPTNAGSKEGSFGPWYWRYDYSLENIVVHSMYVDQRDIELQMQSPNVFRVHLPGFRCTLDYDYELNSMFAPEGHGVAQLEDVVLDLTATLDRIGDEYSTTLLGCDVDVGSMDIDFGDGFGDGLAEWVVSLFQDTITSDLEDKVTDASFQIWDGIVRDVVQTFNTTPFFHEINYGVDISPTVNPAVSTDALDVVANGEIFSPLADRSEFQVDDDFPLVDYDSVQKGVQLRMNNHTLKSFGWTWFTDSDHRAYDIPFSIMTHYSDESGLTELKEMIPELKEDEDDNYKDFVLRIELANFPPNFVYTDKLEGVISFNSNVLRVKDDGEEFLFGANLTVEIAIEPKVVGIHRIGGDIVRADILSQNITGDPTGAKLFEPFVAKMVPFLQMYFQGRIMSQGFDMNILPVLQVTDMNVSITNQNFVILLETEYVPQSNP